MIHTQARDCLALGAQQRAHVQGLRGSGWASSSARGQAIPYVQWLLGPRCHPLGVAQASGVYGPGSTACHQARETPGTMSRHPHPPRGVSKPPQAQICLWTRPVHGISQHADFSLVSPTCRVQDAPGGHGCQTTPLHSSTTALHVADVLLIHLSTDGRLGRPTSLPATCNTAVDVHVWVLCARGFPRPSATASLGQAVAPGSASKERPGCPERPRQLTLLPGALAAGHPPGN